MVRLPIRRRFMAAAMFATWLAAGAPAAAQDADLWHGLAIEGVEAYTRGDDDLAFDKFLQALNIARAFAADDERLINSLLNIALVNRRLRRFDQAELFYLEAIRLQVDVQDPDLVVSLDALGLMYNEIGQAGQAQSALRRALQRLEEIAGPEHPYTGLVLEHLAEAEIALGRYDEAANVLGRIVDIRAANFGPTHRSVAPPLTRQGLALMAVSHNLDALACLRRALAIWRAGAQPPAAELLLTLEALVDVSQTLGRLSEAADFQLQVVAVRGLQQGERGALFADELDEYARLLRRVGDSVLADQIEARALQVRELPALPRP